MNMNILPIMSVATLIGMFTMPMLSTADTGVSEVKSAVPVHVSEHDHDRVFEVRVGESLYISLPENATTGYRWMIDHYDEHKLEWSSTHSNYIGALVGSGGTVGFTFKAQQVGLADIVLKQKRSWEDDSLVIAHFRIQVQIKA
jgi:inhibitor of cysteine peptidase